MQCFTQGFLRFLVRSQCSGQCRNRDVKLKPVPGEVLSPAGAPGSRRLKLMQVKAARCRGPQTTLMKTSNLPRTRASKSGSPQGRGQPQAPPASQCGVGKQHRISQSS